MRLDRDTWRARWDEGDIPSPPCPMCGAPMNWEEDAAAIRMPTHNRELVSLTDVEEGESRFSGWFACGHARCGEVVAVSGVTSYRYDYGERGETVVRQRLHPVTMHPPPPVIRVSDEVPQCIKDVLSESFGLFWMNGESCASRLRVVVELVLDGQDVPRKKPGSGFVSLHERIENWGSGSKKKEAIAKSLMAIKWLGNIGSHEHEVSRDRLLDAYEILDRALKWIYPSDDTYLDELADKMVRSKGRQD